MSSDEWFGPVKRPGRLLRHYFLISVILVAGGLVASGLLEIFFRYRESKEHLALLQQEAAAVAALKIERFIQDIETAMKAAAKGQGVAPDFKFELKRLFYLAPAITQATILDDRGRSTGAALPAASCLNRERFRLFVVDGFPTGTPGAVLSWSGFFCAKL